MILKYLFHSIFKIKIKIELSLHFIPKINSNLEKKQYKKNYNINKNIEWLLEKMNYYL